MKSLNNWYCLSPRLAMYVYLLTRNISSLFLVYLLSFATEDTHLGVAFRNLPRKRLRSLFPCASAVYGNCDIKMKYLGRGGRFYKKLEKILCSLSF